MTEDELAITPGAIATRSEEHPVQEPIEVVFTPQDFRLNLQARLNEPQELTDLDQPSIRKLTWEQVVPERLEPVDKAGDKAVDKAAGKAVEERVETVIDAASFAGAPIVDKPVDAVATPVVASAADVTPVAEPVVATAPPAPEPPVTPASVPLAKADVVPPPPPPREEVNTLASVPDMVVDDSLVQLPQITPSSGPVVASARSVYTPVLPETLFAVSPRPTPPNMAAIVAESNAAWHRATRKQKRHFFRRFFSFVVLLGLLGGGAYAGKMYLQREPTWPADIKPLATDVANTRGLHFKASVAVTALQPDEYATRLATALVAATPDDAASWRAFGLLNGELDLQAIGRQAMEDAPAFYEPASKSVLVTADLVPFEHLYRFALRRALASALLDQRFDWSGRLQTASPASAFALRALIDADALNVANILAVQDAADQLTPERLSFIQANGAAPSPSQYAALIAGRSGAVLRTTVASMDASAVNAMEQNTPASDALFDAARPETALPAVPGTKGLMYWYYVLASRIDDTQAWAAAVHWTGDTVMASPSGTTQCFDAQVAAGDAAGAALMASAFQAWATAAPAESATTVTIADTQVAIHACDPGSAATATTAPKVPVAFGGAAVERALVEAAVSAAAQAKVDGACLIAAARQRNIALASPADDAPVVAADWAPAYVTANLDLAAGCVAPAG